MVNPLYFYLALTCFSPYMISNVYLLLHTSTGLKSIFTYFVCKKRASIYKEKYIAIYILWWCFEMRGGMGILILLWCSSLPIMDMPCMMGICGTYIYSALFISYMFIGKFLILFFQRLILVFF